MTSVDGVHWTEHDTGSAVELRDIMFDGSRFIAVGSGVLTSPDGVTWTPGSLPYCLELSQRLDAAPGKAPQ